MVTSRVGVIVLFLNIDLGELPNGGGKFPCLAMTLQMIFLVQKTTSLQVGKGDKARFWMDPCCGPRPFYSLFLDLYEGYPKKSATLQQFDEWNGKKWAWKLDWAIGIVDAGEARLANCI